MSHFILSLELCLSEVSEWEHSVSSKAAAVCDMTDRHYKGFWKIALCSDMLWICLVWNLGQTQTLSDPTLPDHRGSQGVCSLHHTHTHSPSAAQTQACCQHSSCGSCATLFFSRTQQFPGECGHGQDSEDHGCPAEPLHGVSVLSVTQKLLTKIVSTHTQKQYLLSSLKIHAT